MKKDFWLSIACFILVIVIDQLSKQWGLSSDSLHFNEGIAFGLYKDSPLLLRIITLCSMFGFLFFIYMVLNYLLSSKLIVLKFGMGFMAGGIAGNVIDKMVRGKTIDFIPLPLPTEQTIIFNIADVFQWVGVILIAWKILTADKEIWFPDNQRGKYLVHPREQIKFSLKFGAIAFCVSLLLGIFCFTFMRTTLVTAGSKSVDEMMAMFSIAYISLTLTFSLIVFLVGLIISHKTAGPLYAFELYVEDLLNGNMRTLSLREGDNYKHLEKVADDLKQHFER